MQKTYNPTDRCFCILKKKILKMKIFYFIYLIDSNLFEILRKETKYHLKIKLRSQLNYSSLFDDSLYRKKVFKDKNWNDQKKSINMYMTTYPLKSIHSNIYTNIVKSPPRKVTAQSPSARETMCHTHNGRCGHTSFGEIIRKDDHELDLQVLIFAQNPVSSPQRNTLLLIARFMYKMLTLGAPGFL